jgi:hypothetical protein
MNPDSTKGDCPGCAATLPMAKGTGDGSEPLEPLQAAMLLRTVRMRSVHVDSAKPAALAEADALWQQVTVPAGRHGLAALAETSPERRRDWLNPAAGSAGWPAATGLAANSAQTRTRDPGRPTCPGRRRPGPPGGEWQKIDFPTVSPTAPRPTGVTARDHWAKRG